MLLRRQLEKQIHEILSYNIYQSNDGVGVSKETIGAIMVILIEHWIKRDSLADVLEVNVSWE